jgi:hypothetical protein
MGHIDVLVCTVAYVLPWVFSDPMKPVLPLENNLLQGALPPASLDRLRPSLRESR